jgi:hypothetical protein
VTTPPIHGTLSGTAPSLTYTPAPDYSGTDILQFKVNNGVLDSALATVSITVTPALQVGLHELERNGHVVEVEIKLTNTSSTTATNVHVSAASLLSLKAFRMDPSRAFSLAGGMSRIVYVWFKPLNKGQSGTLSVSGTSSLGSFSLSQTVTIP